MRERYYTIDLLRGFVIINMILYHTVWDIIYIFNRDIGLSLDTGNIWQLMICVLFIFLSGFCWSMSKNHIKRGTIVFLCGVVISFATAVAMPEYIIVFGILTFIGSAVIIMIFLEKLLKHINVEFGFVLCIFLFAATGDINYGTVFFDKINLPSFLYNGYAMTYLGFMDSDFYSTDYFSLLPWIFLFTAGYFAYCIFSKHKKLCLLKGINIKPITYISKQSLLIYIVHQPLIYGFLSFVLKQ